MLAAIVKIYRPDAHRALERKRREMAAQAEPPASPGVFRMWEDPASPYSAKVRAYLRYKEIPYRRMRTNATVYFQEIPSRVGISMIPVILTPDDRVMMDSTSMLLWFESQYPERPIVPADARLAFLDRLLEDFSDEYVLRLSIHGRWNNAQTRTTLAARLARSLAYGIPESDPAQLTALVDQRQTGFLAQLGIDDATAPDLEAQRAELLAILDEHLREFEFVLGDRPSLCDFAFYGQFLPHLAREPLPMTVLETHAPQVADWIDRLSDLGDPRGEAAPREFGAWLDLAAGLPETVARLLALAAETWLPMSRGAAEAGEERAKEYVATIRGQETRFEASHYRAWAFEQVQLAHGSLPDPARDDLDPVLRQVGLLPGLLEGGIRHSTLYDGRPVPFVDDGAADNRIRHIQEKRAREAAKEGGST